MERQNIYRGTSRLVTKWRQGWTFTFDGSAVFLWLFNSASNSCTGRNAHSPICRPRVDPTHWALTSRNIKPGFLPTLTILTCTTVWNRKPTYISVTTGTVNTRPTSPLTRRDVWGRSISEVNSTVTISWEHAITFTCIKCLYNVTTPIWIWQPNTIFTRDDSNMCQLLFIQW